jgi:hypothetical protein
MEKRVEHRKKENYETGRIRGKEEEERKIANRR